MDNFAVGTEKIMPNHWQRLQIMVQLQSLVVVIQQQRYQNLVWKIKFLIYLRVVALHEISGREKLPGIEALTEK